MAVVAGPRGREHGCRIGVRHDKRCCHAAESRAANEKAGVHYQFNSYKPPIHKGFKPFI
jgi:hypothetical protein